MARREANRRGGRAPATRVAPRRAARPKEVRPGAPPGARRSTKAPAPPRTRLRPEAFREHLFRLDRMIDDLAARTNVVLDEPDRVERVEGLVEGALETWAELARQAEEALSRAPSLGALAENLGADPAVRARAASLLRQAGRSWLRPRVLRIERVPRQGPVVLAVRRVGEASGWDAVALRILLEDEPACRPGAGLLADPALLAAPFVGLALERTGGGAIDRAAASSILREGGTVVAFLEDAAARGGASARVRRIDARMVVRLALASRATVVPVAVAGGVASGLLGRLSPTARGGRLDLAFGTPLPRGSRRGATSPDGDAGLVVRRTRELRDRLLDLAREAASASP